jgi:hypothetical protein
MRGLLVLTGKTSAEQFTAGRRTGRQLGRGRRAPDAVAPSLPSIVAALDR